MVSPRTPSEREARRAALRSGRRQLVLDSLGIMASAGGFGVVFGLAARQAGFSVIEASVMSVVVFAGAAQFAAVGFVRAGMPWPAIFLLTALLNARHLLYSAALRPWLVKVPALKRAVMAHFLTDEGFALSVAHFQRLGFADLRGYWLAAIGATFIPWNVATLIGVIGASAIPDPARLGLDVVFPAAMSGLVVALVTGRREIVAVVAGCVVAVVVGLLIRHPGRGARRRPHRPVRGAGAARGHPRRAARQPDADGPERGRPGAGREDACGGRWVE